MMHSEQPTVTATNHPKQVVEEKVVVNDAPIENKWERVSKGKASNGRGVGVCRNTLSNQEWEGKVRHGFPNGYGTMWYPDAQLHTTGKISIVDGNLCFNGHCEMKWNDGRRYTGNLYNSSLHGKGCLMWADGSVYDGYWAEGQMSGYGTLESWNTNGLKLRPEGGVRANSYRYTGEFCDNKPNGEGVFEFFSVPDDACQDYDTASTQEKQGIGHGRWLRRFTGRFKDWYPLDGKLETPREIYPNVSYDGKTKVSGFPQWYWGENEYTAESDETFFEVPDGSEEFRYVLEACGPGQHQILGDQVQIKRIVNPGLRNKYESEKRFLKGRLKKRREPKEWDPATMERVGFHAPGPALPGCEIPPHKEISLHGFRPMLAGGVNGTVLGRGTYFGPLAVANHYAKKTLEKEEKLHPKYRMRVLFTYLISGSYIGGSPGMCVPPHNPKGVEGERYDSLVDNEQNPKIFVMGNSDQMYPAYEITYERQSMPIRAQAVKSSANIPAGTNTGTTSHLAASTVIPTQQAGLPGQLPGAKRANPSNTGQEHAKRHQPNTRPTQPGAGAPPAALHGHQQMTRLLLPGRGGPPAGLHGDQPMTHPTQPGAGAPPAALHGQQQLPSANDSTIVIED